jgi:chitinase
MTERLKATTFLVLALSAVLATGASATPTRVTPSLTIRGVSVAQPDSGAKETVLNVRLTRASTKPVRVHYETQDGTAIGGSDYVPAQGDPPHQAEAAYRPDQAPDPQRYCP